MINNIPFVGRKHELNILKHLYNNKLAKLVVIKGRRRIGKSRLVQEFAKDKTFYQFSGLPPTKETTAQSQREEFARRLIMVPTHDECKRNYIATLTPFP